MSKLKLDFQELVNKYADMIYNIAIRYLGNKEDAEDIVQEAFMKYIKQIKEKDEFNNEEHIKHWLIRVTLNLCNNEISSASHSKTLPLSDFKDVESKNNDSSYINYKYVLNKLSKKYKSVFELFYIEDLKISDISRILNISESNVKTRLKRARDKLRKVCKDGGDTEDE